MTDKQKDKIENIPSEMWILNMFVFFMRQFLRSCCPINLSCEYLLIFAQSISEQISGDKVGVFEEVEASYEEELNASRLKIQQLHIEVSSRSVIQQVHLYSSPFRHTGIQT